MQAQARFCVECRWRRGDPVDGTAADVSGGTTRATSDADSPGEPPDAAPQPEEEELLVVEDDHAARPATRPTGRAAIADAVVPTHDIEVIDVNDVDDPPPSRPRPELATLALVAGAALVLLASALVGGMAGFAQGPGPAGRLVAAEVVGPSGGRVVVPDGPTLDVPEGAVRADTEIRVYAVPAAEFEDGIEGAAQAWSFEPAGLRFDRPATIELPAGGPDFLIVREGVARRVRGAYDPGARRTLVVVDGLMLGGLQPAVR